MGVAVAPAYAYEDMFYGDDDYDYGYAHGPGVGVFVGPGGRSITAATGIVVWVLGRGAPAGMAPARALGRAAAASRICPLALVHQPRADRRLAAGPL